MTSSHADPLLDAVLRTPLDGGSHILVATSGGPDSMAMLDALCRAVTMGARDWELRVGHINHSLRGEESDADEAFVRERARAYGLPIDVIRVDVRAHADAHHLSLETSARQLRYEALRRITHAWGGGIIATGHTADDQLETVVMRLLRGAGVRGLSGIPYRQGDIVRPLLYLRKSVVLAELSRAGLPFRLDRSNDDQRHTRNAVRQQVIPALLGLQPALPEVIGRTTQHLASDADLLNVMGREAVAIALLAQDRHTLDLSRSVMASFHPALRRAALTAALEHVQPGTETDAQLHAVLERLLRDGTRGPTAVRRGVYIVSRGNEFSLSSVLPLSTSVGVHVLEAPGIVETPLGTLRAEIRSSGPAGFDVSPVLGPFHALTDPEAVHWPLEIRPRRAGDRIDSERGSGSRKLQDIFVDRKIPRAQRDSLAVISDQIGVLWVPGVIRDRRLVAQSESDLEIHLIFHPNEARDGPPRRSM